MNLGNTCYINTAVQCLIAIPDFVRFVLCLKKGGDTSPLIESLIDIVAELVNGAAEETLAPNTMNLVHSKSVSPRKFIQELQRRMSLRVHDPNDIQEFLALFLDKLNADLSRKLSPQEFFDDEFHDGPLTRMQKLSRVKWYKSVWNEFSPIKDMFYGMTITQIRCDNCGKIHHNHEPFSTIMVPPSEDPNEKSTLEMCMEAYFKEEKVCDDWKCDGCDQSSTTNVKVVRICRLPRVLSVCVNRFAKRKNICVVDAPNVLDIQAWTLSDGKGTRGVYELRAIACHSGDHRHGHYWGLMKSPVTPGVQAPWYKVDDVFVFHTGQSTVQVPAEAYLFVYILMDKP